MPILRRERRIQIRDSLTAAAVRLTKGKVRRGQAMAWQDEAWDLYDQVGELRFVVNAHAQAVSRARLFAAEAPLGSEDPLAIPEDDDEVDEDARLARDVMASFASGQSGRTEILRRLASHLYVPGDSYLVGLPPGMITPTPDQEPTATQPTGLIDLNSLEWHTLSVNEVSVSDDRVKLEIGTGSPITISTNDAMVVRVWRPHPRRWWQADSPTRANLPVLRELVGLTKHVSATIDSRLSSAGVLVLPQSVEIFGNPLDEPPSNDQSASPFMDTLIAIAQEALQDRDSASAVVPLVVTVPDEVAASIGQGSLIRFSSPFDEHAKELRDEAIRRLSLGLDAPPELLLGMGSINHWGAWLISEENVKTHIDPVLALICDALTTQWLWPVLRSMGVSNPERFLVWWDLSDLTLRPNRSGEAQQAHERGVITDDALRRAMGFDDDDAPDTVETDQAVQMALRLIEAAPALVTSPGLPALVQQIRTVMGIGGGTPSGNGQAPGDGNGQEPAPTGTEIPDTLGDPPPSQPPP